MPAPPSPTSTRPRHVEPGPIHAHPTASRQLASSPTAPRQVASSPAGPCRPHQAPPRHHDSRRAPLRHAGSHRARPDTPTPTAPRRLASSSTGPCRVASSLAGPCRPPQAPPRHAGSRRAWPVHAGPTKPHCVTPSPPSPPDHAGPTSRAIRATRLVQPLGTAAASGHLRTPSSRPSNSSGRRTIPLVNPPTCAPCSANAANARARLTTRLQDHTPSEPTAARHRTHS